MDKPEALRLADAIDPLIRKGLDNLTCAAAAAELRRLHDLVDACEPYLKEGETPAERIERERGDTEAVCRLYAKEREKNVELLEALKLAVRQNEHDMLMTGEELRVARAAIAAAEGETK
jgi:hypothetical protein